MALTPEQIDAEAFARWGDMKGAPLAMCRGFARAIEAEVRKDDEALIRQLEEAVELGKKLALTGGVFTPPELALLTAASTAARARLEKAP